MGEGIGRFANEAQQLEEAVLAIDPALEHKQKWAQLERLPNYLDHGGTFIAFRAPEENLVLKLGLGTYIAEGRLDMDLQFGDAQQTVGALKRGIGLERVEQLHSYRMEGIPAVITHYMTGTTLAHAGHANLPISRSPYERLVDTWRAMETRQLVPDEGASNIIYSLAYHEFGIIDYHINDETRSLHDMGKRATEFVQFILPTSTARPAPALAFRDVCHQQLGAEIAQNVTEIIDENTAFFRG